MTIYDKTTFVSFFNEHLRLSLRHQKKKNNTHTQNEMYWHQVVYDCLTRKFERKEII